MGFFSQSKKDAVIDQQTLVSDMTAEPGLAVGMGADGISDDYIAPNADGEEGVETDPSIVLADSSAGGGATPAPTLELETNVVPSATSLSNPIDVESIEDGYVNANEGGEGDDDGQQRVTKDVFKGVRGTVQPPKWKDRTWAVLFVLHFGVTIWWFYESFLPKYNKYNGAYYSNFDHAGLAAFVTTTGLAGLGLAFFAFGYMLRHGESILKTTIVFSTAMCLGVGVMGLFLGEYFMCVCGLVGFLIVGMYAYTVWKRISFTAANLSVAINAVRDNMGLVLAALSVSAVGFVWLVIASSASISGRNKYGNWTLAYSIFSYYWTHQVLTNVLSVATAGVIGRWFVIGEHTPGLSTGLKEILSRASTYSFGCICFGSLFSGMLQIIQGLSSFLSAMRVPLLPRILNQILRKTNNSFSVNEMSYVYVGLYGYSYRTAGKNVATLFRNKGIKSIVKHELAGNILLMANMTIGLLTGFCGLVFGTFEYSALWSSGLLHPTSDGFFIGFLVGFLFSSILLSVVTATMSTLIVCFAESPVEFKTNHPDLSEKMEIAWKMKNKNKKKSTNRIGLRL